MILEMHEQIKAALFSRTGTGEFTTLVGSRIYDTIATANATKPYVVWKMAGSTVEIGFDGNERVTASLVVTLRTDFTKGVEDHLTIINQMADLREYQAAVGTGVDRICLQMSSIGEVALDDQELTSDTTFTVTSTRV
tara:strand:+ start:2149 stop:2559 length:411 start_codon:yes stop_codon:yes gene_type:complete